MIECKIDDHVAVLTLNNPSANTFTADGLLLIHQSRRGTPRTAALALERERFVDLFDGEDQREGVNAFFEKRAPRWKNA